MILFDFMVFHNHFTSIDTYGIFCSNLLFYIYKELRTGDDLEKNIITYGFCSTLFKPWLLEEG